VDFRGLKTTCVSCHPDPHRPELGACEPCHSAKTFKVPSFTHARFPDFFGGEHAPVGCPKCHTPASPAPPAPPGSARLLTARYRNTPLACASCHEDVHLGQVSRECQTCHSLAAAKFRIAAFPHAATAYALTGKHEQVPCAKCHKKEAGVFPAGGGTAVRYRGITHECRPCHEDVHLGQFAQKCQACHSTASFKLPRYTHANGPWLDVFRGRHKAASCADCHKPVKRDFPGGPGTAVHYTVESACTTCHEDAHRGALGTACIDCHRP
jgi:hypothetical protein